MVNYCLKEVIVDSLYGIHARVAAKVVEIANKFDAEIFIIKDNRECNAKSIIEILMLAVQKGDRILLKASGCDCFQAIEEISNFLEKESNIYK